MYYKVVNKKMQGLLKNYTYKKNEWQTPKKPVLCVSGYHVCTKKYIYMWAEPGDLVFKVRTKGEKKSNKFKTSCENIMLTELVYKIPKNLGRYLNKYYRNKGVDVDRFSRMPIAKIKNLVGKNRHERMYLTALYWKKKSNEVGFCDFDTDILEQFKVTNG